MNSENWMEKFEGTIDLLRCPKCGGEFKNSERKIICQRCGKTAEIRKGPIICFEETALPKKTIEKTMYGPEIDELKKELNQQNAARMQFKPFISSKKGEMRCLDYGCGSGRQIFDLAEEFSDGVIFGLDYDIEPLAIVAETADLLGYKNICLIQQSSGVLPFKKDIFDIVTSHQVLEHVPDPEKSVSEIHRTLKQGGVFEVDFPNGNSIGEILRELFHRLTRTNNPHISRIGIKRAKKMFANKGFQQLYFQSALPVSGPISYLIEGLIFRFFMKKHKIWTLRKRYRNNIMFRFAEKIDKMIGKYFPRTGHAFIFILKKT